MIANHKGRVMRHGRGRPVGKAATVPKRMREPTIACYNTKSKPPTQTEKQGPPAAAAAERLQCPPVKQTLRDRQAVGGVRRPPRPNVRWQSRPVASHQQPLLPPFHAQRLKHGVRGHVGHVQQHAEGHEVRQLEVPDNLSGWKREKEHSEEEEKEHSEEESTRERVKGGSDADKEDVVSRETAHNSLEKPHRRY